MADYVILVAGGKGLRMGGDVPKQFAVIGGRPVLMRTIDAFRRALPEVRVIVVLPRTQHAYWQQLCRDYAFPAPTLVADGGETRFHSVLHGLALIPEGEEGVVGVHDGVRPFVTADVIRRAYAEAEREGTAVPVVPVVETVRQLTDGGSHTVPRDRYRLVQTPQVFRISLLRRAYRQPYTTSFTDDASVVEALGHSVHLTEGNRENIKLTTPADIALAEYLANRL